MASSDYTALRKLKEIQNSCDVDELGDPVSTSWYDIEMEARADCSVVLGTGPTGPIGPTGYTGYTGPVGDTNGGVFTMYAESNGFYTDGIDFIFSFGKGIDGSASSGVMIGADCSLNYIGVNVATTPDTVGAIEIYKNGTPTGITLGSLADSHSLADISYSFVQGDYINIKCLSGSGGLVVNVSLWFSAQGVKGNTGEKGDTGEKGYTGEIGNIGPAGTIGGKGDTGDTGPYGIRGTPGIQGEIGPTGYQGIQGEIGPIGAKGYTGAIGPTGYTGYTGQGIQGIQGATGLTGYTGYTGSTGPQGIQGIQGETGLTGYTGYTGPRGIQGIIGDLGPRGQIGLTGYTGYTGPQGIQGIQGEIGLTGYTGYTGPQGIQGAQGIRGETGLTGYTGYTGPQGIQGAQGIQGETGLTGYTGYTGYTGQQGIQGIQGEIGLTGYTGYTGPQGIQGIHGETGLTGYTGYTGYTGQQGIQGIQGEIGIQGIQGDIGIQGERGYKGDIGDIGNVGETGEIGPTGYTGSQGENGDTGPHGNDGNDGIDGVTGPRGSNGVDGQIGPTGPSGEQGLPGIEGFTGPRGYRGPMGEPGEGFLESLVSDINFKADVIFSGDILPETASFSSIGSITKPFKNIYVKSSTLYFVNDQTPEEEESSEPPTVNALSIQDGKMELSVVDPNTNEVTSNLKVGSNFVNRREDISLFQAITQQPSTFTKDTSIYTNGSSNTTKDLTIYWHYDDIVALITDTSYQAFYNNDSTYNRVIPYINQLYVDISYSTVTNGWENYKTMPISSDYNVSPYKSTTITRKEAAPSGNSSLATLMFQDDIVNFDVRVYGENLGYNYPTIEDRALIYEGVTFEQPNPPGVFNFNNSTIDNYQQLTLSYNYTEPEEGNPTSTAVLDESQTKYAENDTLSSSSYILDTTVNTDIESDESITGGSNFSVILTGLRAGTNYEFFTRIKNDLNSNYTSVDSIWNFVGSGIAFDNVTDTGLTNYTTLPSSDGYSSTYVPQLTYNTTTYVTTPTSVNASITYINVSDNQTVVPGKTSIQSFEISNTGASTSDTSGFGKYIDNNDNSVQVKAYVDGDLKQTISYQGFTPSDSTKSGTATITGSLTGINYFDSNEQGDIHLTDVQQQGYRLYGKFRILTIQNDNVNAAIGVPRNNPYTLKLEVLRDDTNIGGTALTTTTSDIYVDNLSNNPSISQQTETAIVTSVVWTMGIPSVQKYKIDCSRTYSYINSQYKFIRGDRKLSTVDSVSNSSNSSNSNGFSSGSIYIDNNSIADTGEYTYDEAQFSTANNSTLYDLHYTSSRDNNDSSVTLNETIYSLKSNGINNDISVDVNHHFDKDSYNNMGNSLSTKLSLVDIHELATTTIAKLNDDLGGLDIDTYTSHNVVPKNWTLLYYNGVFKVSGYPSVPAYEWNGLTGNYTYDAGLSGLSMSGTEETTGTRYKWIAFKLNKLSSSQYRLNGNDYNLKDTGGIKYLSVTEMLSNSGLFTSSSINNLFNSDNTDIIGFCRVTTLKTGPNIPYIGNLKIDFSPTGGNWTSNGSAQTGYAGSLSGSNGARVFSGTEYGFYLSPASVNDDLTMFIGIKV